MHCANFPRHLGRLITRCLLALYLSAGAAKAQTDQQMLWALSEVGEELQVCSVYFTVVSGCLERQEPAISQKYMQAAESSSAFDDLPTGATG